MLRSFRNQSTVSFLLSVATTFTIALAWALYPVEIHVGDSKSNSVFLASVIMKNFNVLMNYFDQLI